MPAPKSPEGKAAKKIADALNQRGLSNAMVAYFMTQEMLPEVQVEAFDVFMHFTKQLLNTPADNIDGPMAEIMGIADEIERAVRRAGYEFT